MSIDATRPYAIYRLVQFGEEEGYTNLLVSPLDNDQVEIEIDGQWQRFRVVPREERSREKPHWAYVVYVAPIA
jgi:hypothetical protein